MTKIGGDLTTGPETKEIAFFPITQLPSPLPPPYPYWIADALQHSPSIIYKTIEKTSPKAKNTIVMGPFSHGAWGRET
jgi:hypothetical protein